MAIGYIRHDFSANYVYADAYGDKFQQSEMIIDELAKAIIVNKKKIVDFIRGEGINVTINTSINDLTNWTIKLLGKSEQFTDKITNLIVGETNILSFKEFTGEDKKVCDSLRGKDAKKLMIDGIRHNLTLIGQSDGKQKKSSYDPSLAEIVRQRVALTFNVDGQEKKPMILPLWAKVGLITVLGSATIIGIIWALSKFKAKGENITSGVTPINEASQVPDYGMEQQPPMQTITV